MRLKWIKHRHPGQEYVDIARTKKAQATIWITEDLFHVSISHSGFPRIERFKDIILARRYCKLALQLLEHF